MVVETLARCERVGNRLADSCIIIAGKRRCVPRPGWKKSGKFTKSSCALGDTCASRGAFSTFKCGIDAAILLPHTGRSRRRPWAGRTRLRGGDDDGGRTGATVSHRRTERRPLRLLPCPRMRSDASRDAPDQHGPSWGGHGLPPGCNLRELPPDRGRDRLPPHVSDRRAGLAAALGLPRPLEPRTPASFCTAGPTAGAASAPTSWPRSYSELMQGRLRDPVLRCLL